MGEFIREVVKEEGTFNSFEDETLYTLFVKIRDDILSIPLRMKQKYIGLVHQIFWAFNSFEDETRGGKMVGIIKEKVDFQFL